MPSASQFHLTRQPVVEEAVETHPQPGGVHDVPGQPPSQISGPGDHDAAGVAALPPEPAQAQVHFQAQGYQGCRRQHHPGKDHPPGEEDRSLGHITEHRQDGDYQDPAQKDPAHQARQVGAPPGLVQIGGLEDQHGQQQGRQPQQLIDEPERLTEA